MSKLNSLQVVDDISFIGQYTLFRVSGIAQFDNNVNIYNDVLIEGKTLNITGTTGTCNIGGSLYSPNIKCSVLTADTFQKSGIYTQNLNKLYVDKFEGYLYSGGDSSGSDYTISDKKVGYYTDNNNGITSTPYSDISNDILKTNLVLYTDSDGNTSNISYSSYETYYNSNGDEFNVSNITDGTFQDSCGNTFNSAYDENNNIISTLVKYIYPNNTDVDISYSFEYDYVNLTTGNRFYIRNKDSGIFSDGTNYYTSMYDEYGAIRQNVTTYQDISGVKILIVYIYQRGDSKYISKCRFIFETVSTTQIQNDIIVGSKYIQI